MGYITKDTPKPEIDGYEYTEISEAKDNVMLVIHEHLDKAQIDLEDFDAIDAADAIVESLLKFGIGIPERD